MAGLGLVARKCGMTRYFTPEGVSIPVTVALIENNNRVTQIKTLAKDGYCAVQVTTGTQLASRVNKPMAGHYAKAGVEAGDGLWEFALSEKELEGISLGQELKADHFKIGQIVDIVGTTKGKGFAGGIKRHHFKSQPQTHGTSLAHRTLGSTGMNQSPGRVFPGKKMAGQLGNVRRTLQNQEVVHIDMERSLLFIKGVAPGATNGHIMILPSVKGEK